nr:hypothetical protein [Tanacetum cinerariifolium]
MAGWLRTRVCSQEEKGDCLSWGEMVEVMESRVVMEMGEKMAEKGVGKKDGKHCALHSVLK